jgi:peptidoglycan hydrolase-like protein with peptidoglycan-binding domain
MDEEMEEVSEALTEEEFFAELDKLDAEIVAEEDPDVLTREERVEETEPAPVKRKPAPKKPAEPEKPDTTSVPPTRYAVVGGADTDGVYLTRAVFKNMNNKRSLTVHHIQRRLKEWGFKDAYSDRDGFYGDRTKKSVTEFQESLGLEVTGLMNAETMTRLFEGDTNVTVHLS